MYVKCQQLGNVGYKNRRFSGSVFELPKEDEEDLQFDTSDSAENGEVLISGKQYPSIQDFASAIPNHLLLGSLLEHLCFVYEKDQQRSRMLFKVIGQRLAAMNLLSPLAVSDEFSTVRLQHNRAFAELLHAASTSLFQQDHRYLNTDTQSLKTRPKDGLFQAQTSRYLSEFEEICRLGKGSYGKVFRVRNKLDGQLYAVKKILIKNVTREDCRKVLREVKLLSSVQHPYIVGYHTAWMEHVQSSEENPKSVISNLPALKPSSMKESDGSSIVFESSHCPDANMQDSLKEASTAEGVPGSTPEQSEAVCPKGRSTMENFVPCVFLGDPHVTAVNGCPVANRDGSALTEGQSNRSKFELNNSYFDTDSHQCSDKRTQKMQLQLMLYIQMQLCKLSLRDWILERNQGSTTPSDPYGSVDVEKTFRILRAILEGVDHIHSRGIMHRDLKPRNIFLHGSDCHVKIGDFGLACRDIIVDAQDCEPSASCSFHTTGVGTFVYAAPEQLKGSNYDSKSDMYSMGIVAVELFQPFGTEMERVHTLENVRRGKVPSGFSERWPTLSGYISQLTSPEPCQRPSAAHLLQSELFDGKSRVIHNLQRKVEEQEEEIMQLKKQISELQITQDALQQAGPT
ncbi:eukaryotic translation initiation factor 2-alpha kinase 1 isoform X2 [Paramormyrops kingsleyae]|uniref:eukaryotic translation initiation factor 2-alpha kinase 1 isoform X2 n=1 Tax=Paramormyrops kingsleyae TaxID=1676925 RepID=UPI003B97119D